MCKRYKRLLSLLNGLFISLSVATILLPSVLATPSYSKSIEDSCLEPKRIAIYQENQIVELEKKLAKCEADKSVQKEKDRNIFFLIPNDFQSGVIVTVLIKIIFHI